jgi:hypothetical protein
VVEVVVTVASSVFGVTFACRTSADRVDCDDRVRFGQGISDGSGVGVGGGVTSGVGVGSGVTSGVAVGVGGGSLGGSDGSTDGSIDGTSVGQGSGTGPEPTGVGAANDGITPPASGVGSA